MICPRCKQETPSRRPGDNKQACVNCGGLLGVDPLFGTELSPGGRRTYDITGRHWCDLCGVEWSHRTESGGFLFVSRAVCPECAPGFEKIIKATGEENYIGARCPPDQTFAQFCEGLRGGNNTIVVETLRVPPATGKQ